MDDLLGPHRLVRRAGRRDQEPLAVADADVARGTLVDAERIHALAGIDDGLALVAVFHGRPYQRALRSRTRVDYCAAV